MSGRRFLQELAERLQLNENPEDIIVMIDILAFERSIATEEWLSERVYDYAAGIICIILEPMKTPGYKEQVLSLRRNFAGIHQSEELRNRYRNLFTKELLVAPNLQTAINLGFGRLFRGDEDNFSGPTRVPSPSPIFT